MGPVNWLAVILAANFALALGIVWFGPLFGGGRAMFAGPGDAPKNYGIVLVIMLLASTMMGHNFARVGGATLSLKPWLYAMMSGGLALAFVIPAVLLTHLRQGTNSRVALIDAGYWLVAYLAMGLVFFALG